MNGFTVKERVFIAAAVFTYVACCACGDTKITWLADVTADRAETVTGAQSNAVAAAAAHIPRADNPHGVTAAQIGAITAELDPVANAKLTVHTNRTDNPHSVTAVQIGAVPYTGATQTVNLGGNDLIVSNDLHIGDDVFVGGHIEVDGRIDLLGGGRYITGASYISGLVPLDPNTWHVSDRAVSGAFLYSGLRSAVDEAIWTAEYQLSWWASTNGLASTQQVADAVAPLATTAALAVHTNRTDNPHGVTAVQIGALTAELDPVANAKLTVHTNRIDNPHNVTAAQIGALTAELDPVANAKLVIHTNRIDNPHNVTAAQIGALTAELDPVANAKLVIHTNRIDNPHGVTAVQIGAITAELDPVANAALVVHTNRADNPHGVTAVQIGAITAEQDLAALRAYHYGSSDIIESPAGWFVFDGAGTITSFSYSAGRENVVIPWEIGGVPVTAIGPNAFKDSGIVSVIAPQTVTMIGDSAFYYCELLTYVSLPQAQTLGTTAFDYCYSLASVSLPQAQTIGDSAFIYCYLLTSVYFDGNAPAEAGGVFADITPPPTVYVTDPQATGWGAVWNGAPVVRPPLYAEAIYQAGELVATTAALAVHTNRIDNPHNVTAAQIGALTAELDPVANAKLVVHTNRIDNPHSVTAVQIGAITAEADPVAGPRLDRIEAGTNAWQTAYGWGNHAAVGYLLPAALAPYATTEHVAQAIAAIPEPDLSDRPTFAQIAASNALPYTAWTGTVTPVGGTATITAAHGNMPVLVVPDGPGITYVTIATDTYAATSGVSRVSLSIWAGANTIEFLTDEVDYATAPDIPTDGWGTILFRRVSNGRWKGVGL